MSKRDGSLFSIALFGYKKSDVNDYIRRTDVSYDDQLSLLRAENARLLERTQKSEARAEELEQLMKKAEEEFADQIAALNEELEIYRSGSPKGSNIGKTRSSLHSVKNDSSNKSDQKRINIFGSVKKK